MSRPIQTRPIDLYDGQIIFINGVEVYECGNYLGGGASGAVYQATDLSILPHEKHVAIKILSPIGFKLLSADKISSGVILHEGVELSAAQKQGKSNMTQANLWWLMDAQTRQIYAAYEDPNRGHLRELPLPKCIEVWGLHPFGEEVLSTEVEEKQNMSSKSVTALGQHFKLPLVASKYLKWLRSRAEICREVNSMMRVGGGHKNIIALYEVLELVQDSKTTLFLVLELVTGGEIFDRIKNGHGMTEDCARKYFCQLLSGIAHCHAKGVCHRDLKPENLLLSDSTDSGILKIADFGLSAVVDLAEELKEDGIRGNSPGVQGQGQGHGPGNHLYSKHNQQQGSGTPIPAFRRLRSVVGSPHYVAPEVTASESNGYDGRKVDMWSAGVILYGLLAGTLPFGRDLSSCERYRRFKQWVMSEFQCAVRHGKEVSYPTWFFPPQFPQQARLLVCHLLIPDPNERLSAVQALKHVWCKDKDSHDYNVSDRSRQGNVDNTDTSSPPHRHQDTPSPSYLSSPSIVTPSAVSTRVSSLVTNSSTNSNTNTTVKTSPKSQTSEHNSNYAAPSTFTTAPRTALGPGTFHNQSNFTSAPAQSQSAFVRRDRDPPPLPLVSNSQPVVDPPSPPQTSHSQSSNRRERERENRTNSPNIDDTESKERESIRIQQQQKEAFERLSVSSNTDNTDQCHQSRQSRTQTKS